MKIFDKFSYNVIYIFCIFGKKKELIIIKFTMLCTVRILKKNKLK